MQGSDDNVPHGQISREAAKGRESGERYEQEREGGDTRSGESVEEGETLGKRKVGEAVR